MYFTYLSVYFIQHEPQQLTHVLFLFLRGKGPLKHTTDVIYAAKMISESGSRMDVLARQIANQVSSLQMIWWKFMLKISSVKLITSKFSCTMFVLMLLAICSTITPGHILGTKYGTSNWARIGCIPGKLLIFCIIPPSP